MFLGSWIRKRTYWGVRRSRIVVVRLQECIDVLDFFIRGIHNICVGCSNIDEVIGPVLPKNTSWYKVA